MKKICIMKYLAMVSVAFVMVGALIFASCNGGDDSTPAGNSTIMGTVDSFAVGAGVYHPGKSGGALAKAFRSMVDFVVPSARASVSGVQVYVAGTDLFAETAEDGLFVISGVPAGAHQLVFVYEGKAVSMEINVPEKSTVTLRNVRVGSDVVDVDQVQVQMEGNPDDNSNDNSGSSDNSNDNSSIDDNANANDAIDENANDNDAIDENANDNDVIDENANDNDAIDENANDNDVIDNSNDNI